MGEVLATDRNHQKYALYDLSGAERRFSVPCTRTSDPDRTTARSVPGTAPLKVGRPRRVNLRLLLFTRAAAATPAVALRAAELNFRMHTLRTRVLRPTHARLVETGVRKVERLIPHRVPVRPQLSGEHLQLGQCCPRSSHGLAALAPRAALALLATRARQQVWRRWLQQQVERRLV